MMCWGAHFSTWNPSLVYWTSGRNYCYTEDISSRVVFTPKSLKLHIWRQFHPSTALEFWQLKKGDSDLEPFVRHALDDFRLVVWFLRRPTNADSPVQRWQEIWQKKRFLMIMFIVGSILYDWRGCWPAATSPVSEFKTLCVLSVKTTFTYFSSEFWVRCLQRFRCPGCGYVDIVVPERCTVSVLSLFLCSSVIVVLVSFGGLSVFPSLNALSVWISNESLFVRCCMINVFFPAWTVELSIF